jgi:hypothetical protein
MPFQSKAQMKAAFSGGLGKEMQSKAKGWANETPNIKGLPQHKKKKKAKKTKKPLTPEQLNVFKKMGIKPE